MHSEVIVGDIWEGRTSKNTGWSEAMRFQVDNIRGKSAIMRSIPDGDISKTPIDFVNQHDLWRLIKRQGYKTFCEDCNPW